MKQSVNYCITCTTCEEPIRSPDQGAGSQARWTAGRRRAGRSPSKTGAQYYGQSGRSVHARALEHKAGLDRGDLKCPLYKHKLEAHMDEEMEVEMEILSTHKSNISRFIREGANIQQAGNYLEQYKLLNSKSEWGRGKMIRLVPEIIRY